MRFISPKRKTLKQFQGILYYRHNPLEKCINAQHEQICRLANQAKTHDDYNRYIEILLHLRSLVIMLCFNYAWDSNRSQLLLCSDLNYKTDLTWGTARYSGFTPYSLLSSLY